MTCPADPMAANPDKQTTVGLHYLTGRFVNFYEIFCYSGLLNSVLIHIRFFRYSSVVKNNLPEKLQNITNLFIWPNIINIQL